MRALRVLLVPLLLFLLAAYGFSTTYYVDSAITDTYVASATPDFTTYNHLTFETTGGTDSVYKTIADVNAKMSTLAGGDFVLFRCGQSWQESLALTKTGLQSYLTFSAFGTGDKPKIWQANGASTAVVCSTADVDYIHIDGIECYSVRGGGSNGAVNITGTGHDHWWISNVLVSQSSQNGIIFDCSIDSAIIEYTVVRDCDNSGISFYSVGADGRYVTNTRISNCLSYNAYGNDTFYLHYGIGANGNNNIVENSEAFGSAEFGFDLSRGQNIILRNLYSHNNTQGSFVAGGTVSDPTAYYTWDGCYSRGDVYSFYFQYCDNFTVKNSVCYDPTTSAFEIYSHITNFYGYNNTIVLTGTHRLMRTGSASGHSGIHFKNNLTAVVSGAADTQLFYIYGATDTPATIGFDFDYNFYYSPSITSKFIYMAYGANYDTYAEWKSTWSQDAHGGANVTTDPLLANGSTTWAYDTDFRIQSGSPCKDVGITISEAAGDYWGGLRPYNSLYDIGAHEYGNKYSYYIDAIYGNNNLSGTTTATAWQTIAWVNTRMAAFSDGDSILFQRGQTWRDSLLITKSGASGNPITFSSYGTGPQPRIHAVFQINGADWNGYDAWQPVGSWLSGNGDFEFSTEPGDRWSMGTALSGGSTCAQDTTVYLHGKQSLKLYKPDAGGSIVDPGMSSSFKPFGQKYKVRFYGKTDAGANIDLRFQCTVDATNYYLQSDWTTWTSSSYWFTAVIPAGSDWTEFSHVITLPTSGTSMTLNRMSARIDDTGPATAYIDWFRLEPQWQTEAANKYKMYLYVGTHAQASLIIDNVRSTVKSSIANLTTDKDVFYDSATGYYYVYNVVSPELDSREFEFPQIVPSASAVRSIYVVGQSYFTIDGLDLRGGDNFSSPYYGNLHFENCDHFTVTNCTISGGDGCGICWASSAAHNSIDATFTNNVIFQHGGSGGGIMVGRNSDTLVTSGFTIGGNNIHHIGMSSLDLTKDGHAIGLFGSVTVNWTVGNGVIENNEVSYCGQYSVGAEIGLYNAYSVVIRKNNVHHCQESGPKMGTACKDITVYDNLVWKNVAADDTSWWRGGIVVDWSTGGPGSTLNSNIYIYHNTIYGNNDTSGTSTYGHRAGIILHAAGGGSLSNVVVKDNIVFDNYNSKTTNGHQLYAVGTLTSCVLDYNCYYATANVANFIYYVDTLYSLAQFATYQSGKSQDAHSRAVDPVFLNASGTLDLASDYKLKPTSSCINNGFAVAVTDDFWGTPRPQGKAPDIGAYEYPQATGNLIIDIIIQIIIYPEITVIIS